MTGQLAGRRIVVTGAASGMGQSIAERFAAEGALLALLDRDAGRLATVARSVDAFAQAVDVADGPAVEDAMAVATARLGGLDGIVNAAGILRTRSFEESDDALWDELIGVNLRGPARICRASVPYLRQGRDSTIVNIASLGGLRPYRNMSAYGASKGGLVALTKALALELAPAIRANCICPGVIDTPMTAALYEDRETHRSSTVATIALERMGTATDIASAALFLSSRESAFVTGTTMVIDGGASWI